MRASRRARALGRVVARGIALLRAMRERRYGIDEITPAIATELFEDAALELRSTMEKLTSLTVPALGVDEHRVPGAPVPTWRFAPRTDTRGRTVLYLHGGAYVAGSHSTHRVLASAIARRARVDLVLPEYRLAPEHTFPAAVEDALATYRWLLDGGRSPSRIVLAGDSAGGGLAFSLALAIRREGLPRPAGVVGLSPWVDLTGGGESITTNDGIDLWLDGPLVAVGGSAYAPGRETDPLASPVFADLTGLPPVLVHVGSHEVLLDDSVRLVANARRAGVAADLGTFAGMWHVFQAFVGIPETNRSLREVGAWIRRVTEQPLSARPLRVDEVADEDAAA